MHRKYQKPAGRLGMIPERPVDKTSAVNMVTHMKTTIEIADSLLLRAKARARERRVTLRALIEESLAATLDQPVSTAQVKPVTFKGNGLSRDFEGASWDQIRDTIYS
jgi:hypothetical protein